MVVLWKLNRKVGLGGTFVVCQKLFEALAVYWLANMATLQAVHSKQGHHGSRFCILHSGRDGCQVADLGHFDNCFNEVYPLFALYPAR